MSETLADLNAHVDSLVGGASGTEEQEVQAALVVIATGARAQFPTAQYVFLDDSDQGDWLIVTGVDEGDDEDSDDDWTQRASNLYDNRTYVYEPYLLNEVGNLKRRRGPYLLVIDRVLADRDKLLGIPPSLLIVGDTVVCPNPECAAVNSLSVHDRADRDSVASDIWVENGEVKQVDYSRGDGDFQTQDYWCGKCGTQVTMPGNPHEEWN